MIACNVIELRKKMVDNGIFSVTELSAAAQINRNTLSDVLSGKKQPSSTTMNKLIEVLKLDAESAGRIFFSGNLRNT